jgi:hypothetical protein
MSSPVSVEPDNPSYTTIVAFGALAGMGSAYPAFETRIQELLTSQGKQEIVRVRERCATDNIFAYAGQKILETYVTTGTAALDDPIIKVRPDRRTAHV